MVAHIRTVEGLDCAKAARAVLGVLALEGRGAAALQLCLALSERERAYAMGLVRGLQDLEAQSADALEHGMRSLRLIASGRTPTDP